MKKRSFWDFSSRFTKTNVKKSDRMNGIIVQEIIPYLSADYDVLEIACSAGMHSHELAGYVHFWEGCDLSAKMIEKAKKIPHTSKLHFSVQDAEALPYGENTFDVVVFINGLHVVEEPEKALKEIRRVLKPGGYLAIPDYVYEGNRTAKMKVSAMKAAGVKTFHKWSVGEYLGVITNLGFAIKVQKLIKNKNRLSCCVVMAKNRKYRWS